MAPWGWWVLVFGITLAEAVIGSWRSLALIRLQNVRRNDRATMWRRRLVAANWEVVLDVVLFVDMMVIVTQGWYLLIPMAVGSWAGSMLGTRRLPSE